MNEVVINVHVMLHCNPENRKVQALIFERHLMTEEDYPELTAEDKKTMSADGVDMYEKMKERVIKENEEWQK